MTNEDLSMSPKSDPVWLMDFEQMWVELTDKLEKEGKDISWMINFQQLWVDTYEKLQEHKMDEITRIMDEIEEGERDSVLVREML